MSKYSKSFKLKVVQTYLSGKRGQKLVADEFNINRSQVREWVSAYKLNGEAGLTPLNLNRRYSAEFKLSVIAYRRRHHLSLPETAKHFNMASFSTLHVWEQRYNHQGIHALIDRRGDSKMKPQSKNPYVTDKPVEQMTAEVKSLIQEIYHKHKGRYGYRRVWLTLRSLGHLINHKTVQKLMRGQGLKSTVRPKRYKSYQGAVGKVAPNILMRRFSADRPCVKWVTDVTEFNVHGEKVYLSPILDLYNSEIIAYDIQSRPHYEMVDSMLQKALKRLRPNETPVLHSDQGWQYQMPRFQQTLQSAGIRQSISRKGNCLDNAVMENFFGILKTEFYHRQKFESVNVFIEELKEYIHYYNHERIKQKLKCVIHRHHFNIIGMNGQRYTTATSVGKTL